MSIQLVTGARGTGKSTYLYEYTAKEAKSHPELNYIMLVPEQFSNELQKKMISIHEDTGFMNIDVIGFNRLSVRIFDEQCVASRKLMEDFGKSMLIRRIAGELKSDLGEYAASIDKLGFIDEVKSLISELITYGITEDELKKAVNELEGQANNAENETLRAKLNDVIKIYSVFNERVNESYLIAEQRDVVLSGYIQGSELVKKSVFIIDGFTGFTPVQLKLLKMIMLYAHDVKIALTIDEENVGRKDIKEHELYYLSSQTLNNIYVILDELEEEHPGRIIREKTICFERGEGAVGIKNAPMISHMERYMFRYPTNCYEKSGDDISIWECQTMNVEISVICQEINRLVREGCVNSDGQRQSFRYRDIAVISPDLENLSLYGEKVLKSYGIPYFMDVNRKMDNNPFMEALIFVLQMVDSNFNYESVFSFIKSGIFDGLSYIDSKETFKLSNDIESLENYAIEKGFKGYRRWSRKIEDKKYTECERVRELFFKIVDPVYKEFRSKKCTVERVVLTLKAFMKNLEYEKRIERLADSFELEGKLSEAGAYRSLFEKITALLDKMSDLMGDEKIEAHDFLEIMKVGMKDISMGIIPPSQDMVVVGDLSRTRLGDVKAIFFINANDGLLPKKGSPSKIISDRDKEKLEKVGIRMAPSDKTNSFIEQFYLYLMMTKPSERLYISYSLMNNANKQMSPAYIVDRVKRLFPMLKVVTKEIEVGKGTYNTDRIYLSEMLRKISDDEDAVTPYEENLMSVIYSIFEREKTEYVERIAEAVNSIEEKSALEKEAAGLIIKQLKLDTVSKLEKYAGCPYMFFLEYGLRLEKRKEADINPIDIGNILHAALKETMTSIRDNSGNEWDRLSDEDVASIMADKIDDAVKNEKGDMIADIKDEEEDGDIGRLDYILDMIKAVGDQTIRNIRFQLTNGEMIPYMLEEKFDENDEILIGFKDAGGRQIKLHGIIDRVDIKVFEDKVFVKLIDYKTGNKEFSPVSTDAGLSIQLLLYMNILKELLKKRFPDKKIIPAGMYYSKVSDPFLDLEDENDEEKRVAMIRKELRLSGVPNSNPAIKEMQEKDISNRTSGVILPVDKDSKGTLKKGSFEASTEEFDIVLTRARDKMAELCADIFKGRIEKTPISEGSNIKKCDFCAYKEVCRFDPNKTNNKVRKLKHTKEFETEVWEDMISIKREEDEDGNVES